MSINGKPETRQVSPLANALRRTVAASALGALIVAGPALAHTKEGADQRTPVEIKPVESGTAPMAWLLEELVRENNGGSDETLRNLLLAGVDCGHTSHTQYICK